MSAPAAPLGAVTPSAEQAAVLAAAARGDNVLCRAVAGAGKTTTLLLLAAQAPARSFLLLTYNKRLQLEVARRAGPNVEVRTYHSAAGRAYGAVVRNDADFRRAVGAPPEFAPRFDALLLDEAQDMQVEYFAFVRHLLAANADAQVVVVGDALQAINDYRGAHPGFLTDATTIYASARPWTSCRLGTSYRLTPATAAFVNAHLYNAPVLTGGNLTDPDLKPEYHAVAGGPRAIAARLAAVTRAAVATYGPEGVFVLAVSVRNLASSRSPMGILVQSHLAGIPVYVAGSDDEAVDESLLRGKLAILSFNAVKGCERPCVIVVGLDETYFRFYDKTWDDPARIPNVLTVAATRAMRQLVVVAAPVALRTVDVKTLRVHATVTGRPTARRRATRPLQGPRAVSVTDLVRHQHPAAVRQALGLIASAPEADEVDRPPAPPAKVAFGDLTEYVGAFHGAVVPVLAEVAMRGGSDFAAAVGRPAVVASDAARRAAVARDPFGYYITAAEKRDYPAEFWATLDKALAVEAAARTPAEWVALAVADQAFRDGRHHVARQIADYAWVDGEALRALGAAAVRRLGGAAGAFEVELPVAAVAELEILGRADFVEDETGVVWEFKLGALCEEHKLQLGCYLALRGGGTGVLMSLACRDSRRLTVSPADAAELLQILAVPTPPERRRVADVIADYDAGRASGAAPAAEEEPEGPAFSAADAFADE